MFEYFGVKLSGFTFTSNGWVHSCGNRYVSPTIIYGDVSHTVPMTVRETKSVQAMTTKQVKDMLSGAINILNWSFTRKDIPRERKAHQIALDLLEEVLDLEQAGSKIIQGQNLALREGLTLKHEN
ncbi:unnamed protein product [Agarophyton chilense]